ncbi:DUF2156 domain-containing protein [Desulfosediminicola ganghwensis]|uniref:DUF2156 domain-containing protein n=1 Tax=Desulfosediminicola ganghwensis TaxID=2569540 RepID=UPI0010AD74A0|nr:DUF2156 domain-containing protein [Desulfosediminicola ganghwensis]
MNSIPLYPDSCSLSMQLRPVLHDRLRLLPEGISEFTFANLYLFREKHQYTLSRLVNGQLIILGNDNGADFFMLPFELPDQKTLSQLFKEHSSMKCVSEPQASQLEAMGFTTTEDRDNFDYLYSRQELAELKGRKFHKKRNLIKAFINNNEYLAQPLLDEHIADALQILELWHNENIERGAKDYNAAREALEQSWDLQLCGGIYFVDGQPAAYSLGEELANGTSFVIHFEKAVGGFKGLYQFINQTFAAILPSFYMTINREQDLGDPGLRQAKHSYKPIGYVKKYRASL